MDMRNIHPTFSIFIISFLMEVCQAPEKSFYNVSFWFKAIPAR